MTSRAKLSTFLKEVIHWNWLAFCEAEKSGDFTGAEAAVLALIRTTSKGKLGAIKLAIDRVDGKIETPINIKYPEVYFVYPFAESVAELPEGAALAKQVEEEFEEPDPVVEDPDDSTTASLRAMLKTMADANRQVVPLVLHQKEAVEAAFSKDTAGNIPLTLIPSVKSVICANLLNLAFNKGSFEAITEIFDQIDGKLVDTIRVLDSRSSGDGNIYLTMYDTVAPAGSEKNAEGFYMIENKELADQWKHKFSQK